MFYIVLLILFGLLFLIAELILLPGVSIGALLALICYGSATFLAFQEFGIAGGVILTLIILVLSLAATIISLRAQTWRRLSLNQKLQSSSMPDPSSKVQVGARGITVSRLSPMGKVEIDGSLYEAKSQGPYIDQQRTVEVIGFENFSVIVKAIN